MWNPLKILETPPETKVCAHSDCGKEKPLRQFGKNRAEDDGLSRYCKACVRRMARESYQRRKRREEQATAQATATQNGLTEKQALHMLYAAYLRPYPCSASLKRDLAHAAAQYHQQNGPVHALQQIHADLERAGIQVNGSMQ